MIGVPEVAAAAGLAVLALLLLDVVIDREDVAAAIVLGLVVLHAAVPPTLTSVTLGGARVGLADVCYALIAAAGAARHLRLRSPSPPQRLVVALALVLLLSLVRGALEGGVTAFNDVRSYLGFVAAVAYFSTVRVDRTLRERLARLWLWAGGALAALVGLRWTARLGGPAIGPLDASYDAAIRVLSGPETLTVAHIAVLALLPGLQASDRRGWGYRLGLVLLLQAVLLNRRTVWLAMAVLLLVLLVRNRVLARRLGAVVVLGVLAFTAAVPHLPGAVGEDRRASQTATDTGTLLWRIEGWMALVEGGPVAPAELLVGQPFGRGYAREVDGRSLESTPHSFYVQTFLRGGVLGLGALLGTLVLGLLATRRGGSRDGGPLSEEALFLLLVTQATWFLTWGPGAEQGILLGLAVAHRPPSTEADGEIPSSVATRA